MGSGEDTGNLYTYTVQSRARGDVETASVGIAERDVRGAYLLTRLFARDRKVEGAQMPALGRADADRAWAGSAGRIEVALTVGLHSIDYALASLEEHCARAQSAVRFHLVAHHLREASAEIQV